MPFFFFFWGTGVFDHTLGKWRPYLWGSQVWGLRVVIYIRVMSIESQRLSFPQHHRTNLEKRKGVSFALLNICCSEKSSSVGQTSHDPHTGSTVDRRVLTCSCFSTLWIKWLTSHWLMDVWLDSRFFSQDAPPPAPPCEQPGVHVWGRRGGRTLHFLSAQNKITGL